MRINRFLKQFNWRFLLVRIVVNALALAITAAVTPKIYFVDKSILNWLLMAIILGILNALLKPILQFLTLQFLFVTYGLVIVFVNTLILLLLSFLFPTRFAVDNLFWAFVGGLVLGLISSFLESLLGLTTPIMPDEPPEIRQRVEEQAHHVDWLAVGRHEAVAGEQAPAMEPLVLETKAAGPAVTEAVVASPTEVESSTAGPEEGPPSLEEVEAEAHDSVVTLPTRAAVPADAGVTEGPEPVPEPREGQKEDRS
jgi:putative membrane protein